MQTIDGMFAILVPASLAPLIITLLWAERKAKKLTLLDSPLPRSRSNSSLSQESMLVRFLQAAEQLDLVGLFLLGAAVSLILLPLTISQTVNGHWSNGSLLALVMILVGRLTRRCARNLGSIIAMFVVGVVLLVVFTIWDLYYASRPVIAPRFVRNRSVVCASLIGFFDFVSSVHVIVHC
jgi:hypothetical protein